jgi:hypothetical protein
MPFMGLRLHCSIVNNNGFLRPKPVRPASAGLWIHGKCNPKTMDRGFVALGTMRRPIANASVGRNRFIAPIGPAPSGSGAGGFAERRNKAIAPYGPEIGAQIGSFNFVNELICSLASSARVSGEIGLN